MENMRELLNQRLDVAVYNEATGFVVTSEDLAGNDPAQRNFEDRDNWMQGLREGLFMPVELYRDDPFLARIVLGELSADEQSESLAEVSWKLRVPCGVLVVAAGSEYVLGEANADFAEYFRRIPVPPGDYLVTVHTLITSPNAAACLSLEEDADGTPRVGKWWRETRAGEKMPLWLQNALAEGYYADAAEAGEAGDEDYDPAADPQVDFIVQLRPLTREPPGSVLEAATEGWFLFDKRHTLAQCPRGLPAQDLWDPMAEAIAAMETPPLQPVDVEARFNDKPASALPRSVSLPSGALRLAFRPALYANDDVDAELLLEYPATPDTAPWRAFDFIALHEEGRRLRVGFEHREERWALLKQLQELEPVLTALPNQVSLELLIAAEEDEEAPREAGTFRFAGRIENGQWRIEAVYPQLNPETLEAMLALSRAADANRDLPCSREEAEIVLDRCRRDPALEDMKIVFDKSVLRIKPRPYLELLALHLFQVRYAGQLPLLDEDAFNREINADIAQIEESVGSMFALPITDEIIYAGQSGRFVFPDFCKLPLQPAQFEELHTEFTVQGFQALGIFVCERFGDVLIFGYSDGQETYAVRLASTLGGQERECYTAFLGGKSLTTSTNHEAEDPAKGYFRREAAGGFAEVAAAHRETVAKYRQQGWVPLAAPATLADLAQAMDEFIVRTLGDGTGNSVPTGPALP